MKRVISLLLVVSMLFSFAITSFAASAQDDVLRFRKNGTFKILVLADVQDIYPIDPSMMAFLEEALDYADPDLVVFGGDNVSGYWEEFNYDLIHKTITKIVEPISTIVQIQIIVS